ncbi:hypothetical protein QUB17_28890, partial [Microcoleus sp. B5-C4]|uniref:hypothetical protein n=1 Tax=Microcoleus sp. B5-C4 TaxID=2818675 RepID=UPI002FD4A9AD
SETGFLTKISVRCQNYRRNPVSWIWVDRAGVRNRVSHQNFGEMPKLSQKPGFLDLGRSRGSQKPGFFPKSGVRMLKLSQKPGLLE